MLCDAHLILGGEYTGEITWGKCSEKGNCPGGKIGEIVGGCLDPMQDYKFLCAAEMICGAIVNTYTDTQACRQLWTSCTSSSAS